MQLKYMGSSHVREFLKGETFNGSLDGGLPADIRFELDSGHVLDTTALDLDDTTRQAVEEALLRDPSIIDVSDHKLNPVGLAEQLWQGVPSGGGVYEEGKEPAPEPAKPAEPEVEKVNPAPVGGGGEAKAKKA